MSRYNFLSDDELITLCKQRLILLNQPQGSMFEAMLDRFEHYVMLEEMNNASTYEEDNVLTVISDEGFGDRKFDKVVIEENEYKLQPTNKCSVCDCVLGE